jgi:flagellar motility protein MotE (MotC chaperone)
VIFKICLVGSMLVEPLGLKDRIMAFVAPAEAPAAVAVNETKAAESRPLLATPTAQAAEAAPQAAPAPPQSNLSRDALQRRQDDLARKEQDMRTLEKDLDDRLMRLQELEVRIQAMLKEAEEVKSAKYRHLVDVLGNMKAKQAASVLETLDEKIAVKVLAGMRGRQAGEILTYVVPAKAARLSESLARVQMPFE